MTEEEIVTWVIQTLSVKRTEFGGLPACPFALKALSEQKVVAVEPPIDMIAVQNWLQNDQEVIIYWFDPDIVSEHELTLMCDKVNLCYPDLVALEDHPHHIENVAGYNLNQGQWALILIQHRKKLELARERLKQTDYYKHWDPEYLRDVLGY